MTATTPCTACNGNGVREDRCGHCNGSGEGMWDGSTCLICRGRGDITTYCEACAGEGTTTTDEDENDV